MILETKDKMDESKIILYRYIVKEERKENLFMSRIIAPTINLVMEGSPKRIEINCYDPRLEMGWNLLQDLYQAVNPCKEYPQIHEIIDGFNGKEKRGTNLLSHRVMRIKDKPEERRIARLILGRPSLTERLEYSARSIFARDDIFRLDQYISSAVHFLNESWGGKTMPVEGIIYRDAARLRLHMIGELHSK